MFWKYWGKLLSYSFNINEVCHGIQKDCMFFKNKYFLILSVKFVNLICREDISMEWYENKLVISG